jgi:hypothetical protein
MLQVLCTHVMIPGIGGTAIYRNDKDRKNESGMVFNNLIEIISV